MQLAYAGAEPLFVDVDVDTMGLSPEALKRFLEENAEKGRLEHLTKPQEKEYQPAFRCILLGFRAE